MSLKSVWAMGVVVVLAAACGETVIESDDENGESELPLAGESCSVLGELRACETFGETMLCARDESESTWRACAVRECQPDDTEDCTNPFQTPLGTQDFPGKRHCEMDEDGAWRFGSCIDSSSATPLAIAFDDAPVSFTASPGAFSLDPRASVATDWIASSTPWLALDRDGNGAIDDGGELFGSATSLADGRFATHGFVALAELDANGDGTIDARDPSFDSLLAWTDANQDRRSDASELAPLASLGIASISLEHVDVGRCDATGNCERQTSRLEYRSFDGRARIGRVVDVTLAHR